MVRWLGYIETKKKEVLVGFRQRQDKKKQKDN